MKTKTIIRISKDYDSNDSYRGFLDDINYIVNEIDVYCVVKNNDFLNVVEDQKRYVSFPSNYKKETIVEAKGYSQGDWQVYTLYHDLEEDNSLLLNLIEELQKSFTHFNDYVAETFESIEIDGKTFEHKHDDAEYFSIRYEEFPDKEDVIYSYSEQFGDNYDQIIINID